MNWNDILDKVIDEIALKVKNANLIILITRGVKWIDIKI